MGKAIKSVWKYRGQSTLALFISTTCLFLTPLAWPFLSHSSRGEKQHYRASSCRTFFQRLKRERIKKKIYGTREEARNNVFDYIEMFYNSRRRHTSSDQMSPNEDEQQYYQRLGSF
jgi:transposase InsO family protein